MATIGSSAPDVFVVRGEVDHVAMGSDLSVPAARRRGLHLGDAIRVALFPDALFLGDVIAIAADRDVAGAEDSASNV